MEIANINKKLIETKTDAVVGIKHALVVQGADEGYHIIKVLEAK
jgi:hypothetical protein